jgi:hypothetical protein
MNRTSARPLVASLLRIVAVLAALWPAVSAAGGPAPAPPSAAGWQVLLHAPTVRVPTGLAIDLRGSRTTAKWAYVADAATGRIVKFGTNGRFLGSWSYRIPGQPPNAASVAVGGSGNVFVADPVAGFVSKYTPSGALLARWTGFSAPQSIAVAPSGVIYLAETGRHQVTALSPDGLPTRRWDTAAGFLQQYTVPPTASGQLGYPTNVALQLPDSLFVSTRCVIGPACTPYFGTTLDGAIHPAAIDALLNLRISGDRAGYLGDWWFGLGHTLTGAPQGAPAKETEPFVTIERMTSNQHGTAYLAGEIWALGQEPSKGVIQYSSLGSHPAYWPLASQSPVAGVAVDNLGRIYVAQDNRILRLDPSKTPGTRPPY